MKFLEDGDRVSSGQRGLHTRVHCLRQILYLHALFLSFLRFDRLGAGRNNLGRDTVFKLLKVLDKHLD